MTPSSGDITLGGVSASRGRRTRWVKTVQTVIRTVWYEVDDTLLVNGIFMSWKHGLERNAIHRDEHLTDECIAEIVDIKPKLLN